MLDIAEDYKDTPLFWSKDVYLIQAFVNNGYRSSDLKFLNSVHKYIRAVSLADIAIDDGQLIFNQAFEGQAENRLRENGIKWSRSPSLPPHLFIVLWKLAISKCLMNEHSNISRRYSVGLYLGALLDQDVNRKWTRWKLMLKIDFPEETKTLA